MSFPPSPWKPTHAIFTLKNDGIICCVCVLLTARSCVCVCVCSMLTSTVFLRPGLIRIGCGAVAGQLRGQTVNVNRELLLYSRQHDTVQSMRYFHSRVVLPALYCQRIHTYACAAASCCLASNLSNRELHTARICLGECIHKIAPKPPFESPK